ncbi:hypothetical protein HDV05_005246 [Chytridiales sp. JEL 0842]|nr:hypothetical protein HDV05_005246 [Chytridiales sp. JEL 0842]
MSEDSEAVNGSNDHDVVMNVSGVAVSLPLSEDSNANSTTESAQPTEDSAFPPPSEAPLLDYTPIAVDTRQNVLDDHTADVAQLETAAAVENTDRVDDVASEPNNIIETTTTTDTPTIPAADTSIPADTEPIPVSETTIAPIQPPKTDNPPTTEPMEKPTDASNAAKTTTETPNTDILDAPSALSAIEQISTLLQKLNSMYQAPSSFDQLATTAPHAAPPLKLEQVVGIANEFLELKRRTYVEEPKPPEDPIVQKVIDFAKINIQDIDFSPVTEPPQPSTQINLEKVVRRPPAITVEEPRKPKTTEASKFKPGVGNYTQFPHINRKKRNAKTVDFFRYADGYSANAYANNVDDDTLEQENYNYAPR